MANERPSESDRQAIGGVVTAFFTCLKEQNYDGIDALFHEDGTMWNVYQANTYRGAAQRYELWAADREQFTARGRYSWSAEQPDIDVWGGNVAVCRYRLTSRFDPPNATSGHFRITDVLWRVGDGWKIVHHHEAPVPRGSPPVTEPRGDGH